MGIKCDFWSSLGGAAEMNLTPLQEDLGLIPGLTQRVRDPEWLWLWLRHRPAAIARIGPLAWELPYATGAALKKKKAKKTPTFFSSHLLPLSVLSR